MKIKHPKLRGEWAELRFMARAAEHGLQVTKPWGETARYNFVVEHAGTFVRVQVKSTGFVDRGGYSCSARGCRGPYEGDPFDFLTAGVEGKLCLRKDPAAAGVVGTVNRRFKVLWENRSLVFPQNRQFPQCFSPT